MTKKQRLQAALTSKAGRNANVTLREKVFRMVASQANNAPHSAPAMVARLSKQGFDVNAVTVNNHLNALNGLGLVEAVGQATSEGRGRPATVWGLTEAGNTVAELR